MGPHWQFISELEKCGIPREELEVAKQRLERVVLSPAYQCCCFLGLAPLVIGLCIMFCSQAKEQRDVAKWEEWFNAEVRRSPRQGFFVVPGGG
jgi:hypothetical protein